MSQKLQAFARVPRAGRTVPKRTDFVRIDANFLERMQNASMNQDLSTIMTKTESKLTIEINAQANIGYSLKDNHGKVVADQADIQRIQNLGNSITKERKAAVGDEVSKQTKFALAAFVQKGEEIGSPISQFHKSFLAVYRSVNAQFQTVTKNASVIESFVCTNEGQDIAKNALIEMVRRTSIAVGKYLFHRANLKEDESPEKLNAFLYKVHVPICIYSKLSSSVITAGSGFDVRHILFPKDPSKGFFLTFKEARDSEFTNDLLGLAGGSTIALRMANNDALVRLMINVAPDVNLSSSEDNTLGVKLASTPIFMLPYRGGVEPQEVLGFLAKNGVRGVNWASGTVLTPTDLLKFYGTVAKRMYYGLLLRPSIKGQLFEAMFEGFAYDVANDKTDVYGQLKSWSQRPGSDVRWFDICANPDELIAHRELIKKVFVDVTMVGITHHITQAFTAQFTESNIGSIHSGTTNGDPMLFTEVKNIAVNMRERAIDPDVVIGGRISIPKLGREKKNTGQQRTGIQERSMLTTKSQSAIKVLDSRGYRALSLRMRTWFRLFLDETVQEAVAAVFLARLESFLDLPLNVTKEERGAFMEPDDPDDVGYDTDVEENPAPPAEDMENPDEI